LPKSRRRRGNRPRRVAAKKRKGINKTRKKLLAAAVLALSTLSAQAITIHFEGIITETFENTPLFTSWIEVGEPFSVSLSLPLGMRYRLPDNYLFRVQVGDDFPALDFWFTQLDPIPGGYQCHGEFFGGWGSDNFIDFAYGTNVNFFSLVGIIAQGDVPIPRVEARGAITRLNVPDTSRRGVSRRNRQKLGAILSSTPYPFRHFRWALREQTSFRSTRRPFGGLACLDREPHYVTPRRDAGGRRTSALHSFFPAAFRCFRRFHCALG
jgi:hypothetical protein